MIHLCTRLFTFRLLPLGNMHSYESLYSLLVVQKGGDFKRGVCKGDHIDIPCPRAVVFFNSVVA